MKTLKTFMALALIAAIAAAPGASFAKDKDKDHENRSSRDGCVKAFSHLIAPGWIKLHGNVSLGENCHVPKGIFKKFYHASSTPDATDPVISDIRVKATDEKATVAWKTDENSLGTVFVGTTTPSVNESSTGGTSELFYRKNHSVTLYNLEADTTYYVVVMSRDRSGNVALSDAVSFTTDEENEDVIAPIISNIVTIVSSSSLKVTWKTNEPATSKLFYGTGSLDTNSSSTLQVNDASLKTNHSLMVSGLASSTLYNLIIQSADAEGNVSTSLGFSANTSF